MITSVWQMDGENILIVEYASGACRYVGLGDSYYKLTKTQRDFMNRATVRRVNGVGCFNESMTIWEV